MIYPILFKAYAAVIGITLTSSGFGQIAPSLWPSARANALGEAMLGSADDLDAAYYNPAGIGGLFAKDKKKASGFTILEFPHLAASLNEHALELNSKVSAARDLNDTDTMNQVANAYLDESQYLRFSLVPALVYKRFMVNYIYDTQLTAIATGQDSDTIEVVQQQSDGLGVGFSIADQQQRFFVGVYTAFLTKKITDVAISLDDFRVPETRNEIFDDNTTTYNGSPIHFGSIWRFANRWQSRVSLVWRDVGQTRYRPGGGAAADLVVSDDVSIGIAATPTFKKWGKLDMNLSLLSLNQDEIPLAELIKLSLEYSWGEELFSAAPLAVRAAVEKNGFSFGLGLNLGILGLDLTSAVRRADSLTGPVVQRQYFLNFGINVAD